MTKLKSDESTSGRLCWMRERELGIKFSLGHVDRFHKTLYSSTAAVDSWNQGEDIKQTKYGGVFNLEYSPDGSLLVAACEKKSILMFDPLNRRLIHGIDSAHNDCVNCVKFLDQRMFATCSDDKTVALWDARNLKQSIRTLQGHSNWVKNIEYSPSDGLLLTSGFDGTIYTWDINSFTENSFLYNRVFHTNGLMRTRLSPDATKMLMCTTAGYLMVVHNLKLSTLSHDLVEFKPNMYRLMQLSQTTFPSTANFTHLFSRTRKHNRVEFLTDFPLGDDAEVISSLQVHPQGWCALSRNVSSGEKSEWTCVHDIQEGNNEIEISDDDYEAASPKQQQQQQQQQPQSIETSRTSGITYSILLDSVTSRMMQQTTTAANNTRVNDQNEQPRNNDWHEIRRISHIYSHLPNSRAGRPSIIRSNNVFDITGSNTLDSNSQQFDNNSIRRNNGERNIIENNNRSTTNVELHVSSSDVWEALVAIREARDAARDNERELYTARSNSRNWLLRRTRGREIGIRGSINNNFIFNNNNNNSSNDNNTDNNDNSNDDGDYEDDRGSNVENENGNSHTVVIVGHHGSASIQNRSGNKPTYAIPRNHKVHQNISRLTHYIEEPNVGSGYIKELCFSADGRLICSPFGNGIRLLAFSNKCEELSNCVPPPNTSVQLHELATKVSHSNIVLSTKFSPRHCLLVSGCLGGKIVWYQPVI